ncbi:MULTISPECIES: fimbrial protein [Burkholderia]|uniref:Fimbrial protein n=1 Tax=Burkholderia cenocepacia TaxID=95486 RepID=A0A071MJL6_9BURK|nr:MULTISPECIES: fimbrial protein [Burkholderia]AOJ29324.1 fimbrial protein [Burkholderia seminalis]KVF52214.1 fimbrial protein [Burkholderia seminalis]MBN3741056.1 type 1 fimbrial protein [Burkholderia sp. Tr-20355]MCA8041197.1 type 1 fimbrial protein [Burkholderia seminalis]MCA8302906.1 type 1 fimbrial protein [Burkholderia seminalis]
MKKIAMMMSAAGLAFAAMNAAHAADGTINFTGEIVAASCGITGGNGTSVTGGKGEQSIDVKLGKVSTDALGGTAGGGIAAGTAINLVLDCGSTAKGLTTVKVRFDPASGSGVDSTNNKLLKTTGTAAGVGIGIYNTAGTLLNLNANETFDAPLVKGGTDAAPTYTANLAMRAGYVKNGVDIVAGTANGTLPFTLTYE